MFTRVLFCSLSLQMLEAKLVDIAGESWCIHHFPIMNRFVSTTPDQINHINSKELESVDIINGDTKPLIRAKEALDPLSYGEMS